MYEAVSSKRYSLIGLEVDDATLRQLLEIARRHCKLVLGHGKVYTPAKRRRDIVQEIETLRSEREALIAQLNEASNIANLLALSGATFNSKGMKQELKINWRIILLGGLIAPGGYLLFLFALSIAPVAQLAPMREIGTGFGTLMGIFILREKQGTRRIITSILITLGMAADMGIELLTEEQYRELRKLGNFDMKTSSWVQTPASIRKLGGAIFCDRRYGTVFVYHNGAESYYAARGVPWLAQGLKASNPYLLHLQFTLYVKQFIGILKSLLRRRFAFVL